MFDFKTLQRRINIFVSKHSTSAYNTKTNYKLPLSDALFCAQDWKRNEKFFEAISQAVSDLKIKHSKICVIDAGSGIGVLGLFALLCGADEVLFLEHNPETLKLCKIFLENEGFSDQSIFLECDATTVVLDKKYQLLLSETLSKNIQEEDFLRIIVNLVSFLDKDGVIIPESIQIENHGQKQTILSKNIPENITGKLKEITLYKNIKLTSGESQSLLNERD